MVFKKITEVGYRSEIDNRADERKCMGACAVKDNANFMQSPDFFLFII